MTLSPSLRLRMARNAATLTLMDAAGVGRPARAMIYDGGDALLVTLPFASPVGEIQEGDGRIALAIGEAVMAAADGVPVRAEVVDGDGLPLWSCSASMHNGTGDIRIAVSGSAGSGSQIWAGGLVQIAGGTLG